MESASPFSTEPIYRRETTSPSDKAVLEQITEPKQWDSNRFKAALVATAALNNGQSIPAYNRPDSVNLQSWKPFLDEMQQKTIDEGRETGRVVLADFEEGKLILGRLANGEEYHVAVDPSPQPGRERTQVPVTSIHIHPHNSTAAFIGHGLSAEDYKTFLVSRTEQAAVLGYGRDNWIMVLKTSVTPNNLSQEAVNSRVDACVRDTREEYAEKTDMQKVVALNKEICSQLGLTMYMGQKEDESIVFRRVEVTN